jgi:nitrogen regulatory protein PII
VSLQRLVAIIKPFTLDAVVEALGPYAADEIEVQEVRGYGRQKGHLELYAGSEYELSFLPKVRLELMVVQDRCNEAVTALCGAAHTGRIGDGKIFVFPAEVGAS